MNIKTYEALKPCKYGHTLRYISNDSCVSCCAIKCKEYREGKEVKEKRKVLAKEYRKNNKEKISINRRKKHLRISYDLTLEEYNKMHKDQKGLCKICEKDKKLVVDHCHKTGKIRGLLCNRCNVGLGYFYDTPKFMEFASLYLSGKL